jgi:hypothetical protein
MRRGTRASRRRITTRTAPAFVKREGLVLLSARGPVPNLAEAVAGAPIRGSWWGHPRGQQIFDALGAVGDSRDVVTCRLVAGKLTFVHRRLWPALVRVAERLPKGSLDVVGEEHTASGAHRQFRKPFPRWVPRDVWAAALRLSEARAGKTLAPWADALGLEEA